METGCPSNDKLIVLLFMCVCTHIFQFLGLICEKRE